MWNAVVIMSLTLGLLQQVGRGVKWECRKSVRNIKMKKFKLNDSGQVGPCQMERVPRGAA